LPDRIKYNAVHLKQFYYKSSIKTFIVVVINVLTNICVKLHA